jgi:Divergent InlB B-repeat domain
MSQRPRRHRSRRALAPALAATALLLAALPTAAQATAKTLTVSKPGTGTGTVTSSPAGISCGSTCSAEYDIGTEVVLSAVSGANTAAVLWSGCASVSEGKCHVTMSANKAIGATFNLNQVELKVTKGGLGTGTVKSTPTGIECGGKCAAKFDEGSTVTLTGTPGANTLATQWSGCDSVDAEGKCLVTMSGAKEVTATFNIEGPRLTVSRAGPGPLIGAGPGTVTSSPAGIGCPATCAVNFVSGTTVTLTAADGTDTELSQWSGCDNVTVEDKCEVTMSAAKSVTATYALKAGLSLYTVTAQRTGTGSGTVTSAPAGIECGSSCSAEVVAKTPVTLTATPAEGSVFSHWSGGGCTGTAPCEKAITSTRVVKAVFTAVGTRTLSLSLAGTGTGSVKSKAAGIDCSASCSPRVVAGKTVTLSAKAATGSTFSGFSGACTGTKACKVTMSEARSVTATFAKVPVPAPATASVAAKAKVKGGRALVRVSCSAGASSCRGSLKLTAKLKGKGKKNASIGSATFSLAPGSSTTLKITLSAKAKQALEASGKLKARVSGEGIGGPHALSLKLASK